MRHMTARSPCKPVNSSLQAKDTPTDRLPCPRVCQGASVNVETSSGRTPLVEACRNGHLHVAKLLVQYGVVVEHVPRHRKTAFDHADWAGHQVTHTHFYIRKDRESFSI